MSKQKSSFGQSDIVRLSDEDAATELLERAVTGLWEVVNELTRFRRTTRQNYRVTIFGSARLRAGTPAYEGVKQLAAELTKMGCDIISGGGPGLMQAANEGAQSIEKATHRSRRHPSGVTVRAGDQPVLRRSGLRTSHLLFATTPFYDRLRRVRSCCCRWYWNSVGVVARMATPSKSASFTTRLSFSWEKCGPNSSNGVAVRCSRKATNSPATSILPSRIA